MVSRLLALMVLIGVQNFLIFGQELSTDVSNYAESEEIIITFSDGPGNPKDWVGIYKFDMVAGEASSLAWLYVNGSETSGEGLTDGDLVFSDGLIEEGIYEARFFEDDSYTILAKATFTVGDIGTSVKTDKEIYMPGELIVADFLVGPANPKDWVGLYKVDMVPGDVGSLAWFYVDGSKDGTEGVSTGAITFDAGMVDAGNYKAVFFEDDGYTVLAETFFKVHQPAPDSLKLVSISPVDGEKNADPEIVFSAIIRNGGTALKSDSVKLSLDSKDVKVEIATDEDGFNTVSYTSDRLFEPGSSHKFQLEFSDDSDPVKSEIVTVDFDVASYLKIDMPDPIHYQDFNQIEEFELPEDWEVVNLSQEINSELDPDDFTSAFYEGWVNVGMSRWSNSGSWAEKSIFSTPLSYMGFSGYINPFTLEANINYNIPKISFPVTICHEIAHQIGYAFEDEANYIAIKVLSNSNDNFLKYSGNLMAVQYLLSEIRKNDIEKHKDYIKELNLHRLEMHITFENFNIHRPQVYENNGATKIMFPSEARLRNFTYASSISIDITVKYIARSGESLENTETNYKYRGKRGAY